MSYSVRINDIKIFDTSIDDDRYRLSYIELDLPSRIVLTIPSENKVYGNLKRFTDYVDVYHDDELIFSGRVYSISEIFNTDKVVECESLNSILRDAVSRPKTFENKTNRDVFTELIAEYNSQVEERKQITVGRITVPSESCYRDFEVIEYMNVRINTLAENYDSRVVVKKQSGNFVIDWLDSYDEGCDQTIDFGSNLLDITWADDNAEFVTRLVPQGAADDNGNRIGITSVTEGNVDYIEAPQEYTREHGYITGTRIWEDVTEPTNLIRKARAWLEQVINPVKSITVTAIDLSDAGYDLESFKVGQRIKVKSSIHGIDGFFDCTAITIYPFSPASNRLELGTMVAGYVENNINKNTDTVGYIANIVKKQTVTKTDLDIAIERATAAISGSEGGYIVINDANGDNEPDEILVMDTPDISTARQIWRFNKNGLGYSNKGYDGPYATALTSSGEIVADMITSGVLNGALIKAGSITGESIDLIDLFSKNITATNMHISGGTIDLTTDANESAIKLSGILGTSNKLETLISPYQIKKVGYSGDKKMASTSLSSSNLSVYDGDDKKQTEVSANGIGMVGGMFKIVEKTLELTIPATGSYYKEGIVNLTPDAGYEIIGLGGYYLSGSAQMLNVYRMCIARDKNLWYGISNTGNNQQTTTLYYYVLEARTYTLT